MKGGIILYGIQASGKGTQGAALSKILGIPHVSAGDALRAIAKRDDELARQVKSYVDNGKLLPDEVLNAIMEDGIPQECVIDGFTRSVGQSAYLDSIRPIRACINLTIPEPEIARRVAERSKREGRADDNSDALAVRVALHRERAPAILAHYESKGILHHIDGDKPIELVTMDILMAIGEQIPENLRKHK